MAVLAVSELQPSLLVTNMDMVCGPACVYVLEGVAPVPVVPSSYIHFHLAPAGSPVKVLLSVKRNSVPAHASFSLTSKAADGRLAKDATLAVIVSAQPAAVDAISVTG